MMLDLLSTVTYLQASFGIYIASFFVNMVFTSENTKIVMNIQ